jgi:hypothetical protein
MFKPLAILAAALAGAALSLTVTTASASAATDGPHCQHDGRTYNACLSFEWLPPRYFDYADVTVGIDVYMPAQYAREIITCGADFKATLRGDDGKGVNDQVIRTLSVAVGWPSAGPDGIGAELIGLTVSRSALNEDSSGEDELYARVSFFDCHTGWTREFETGYFTGFY